MIQRVQSRILVVEDEPDIRELITLHLSREGYKVDEAADGEEAVKKVQTNTYDLYILDWMLPQLSGLELTRLLRSQPSSSQIPILMVTARMEAADIVAGLEAGSDDYVTKPFEIPVLLARVRALLRRAAILQAGQSDVATEDSLEVGNLKVDLKGYEVSCAGEAISLTPSEFKLLTALLKDQGRVLTRSQLIDHVQGEGVAVVDRAIDTHVFGLRKKLGKCGDLIETVRGIGYRVK